MVTFLLFISFIGIIIVISKHSSTDNSQPDLDEFVEYGDPDDWMTDPMYSHWPGNIFYHSDDTFMDSDDSSD
jgi:hypothetical protein